MKSLRVGSVTAVVDDDVWEWASQRTWHAKTKPRRDGTVLVYARDSNGIYLHRLIMNAPAKSMVNHANGNTLDNRRENLRFATATQIGRNKSKRGGARSRFKGVMYYADRGRWRMEIELGVVDGRRQRIRVWCRSEIEAAREHDRVARQHFGEFARLNFAEDS